MENKILGNIICGTETSVIRKAYFSGKLNKLLLELQAKDDWGGVGWDSLKLYLESLKKKDEQITNNFASFLPKVEIDAPDSVLDELNKESLSEAELQEINKEQVNRENAVRMAGKMLKGLFNKFYDKAQESPSDENLMNMAFEMLALQYYLIRDALYKERLFRKRIVEFERMGRQRKLAEEMAKTETPYREWQLAEGLKETANEFINLVKKRYRNI